jgi:hypothetical protein
MLMGRFCIFFKNKTVNYHMQVCEGASRTCQDKIDKRLSPDKWVKYSCHGKFYKWHWLSVVETITPNGPAIKGGCVTRRQHRAGSWYFSQKTVTVQGGYGACFCHQGTRFCRHYECRVTSFIGVGKLSRYRIFVGSTGAVSRYNLSRRQKAVTVQNLN